MKDVELADLPDMVLVDNEPVFNEPWEAQAFAMAINLHQKGAFTWTEWAAALSSEILGVEKRSYYQHWPRALDSLSGIYQRINTGTNTTNQPGFGSEVCVD